MYRLARCRIRVFGFAGFVDRWVSSKTCRTRQGQRFNVHFVETIERILGSDVCVVTHQVRSRHHVQVILIASRFIESVEPPSEVRVYIGEAGPG